jgi:hypothetical protein
MSGLHSDTWNAEGNQGRGIYFLSFLLITTIIPRASECNTAILFSKFLSIVFKLSYLGTLRLGERKQTADTSNEPNFGMS